MLRIPAVDRYGHDTVPDFVDSLSDTVTAARAAFTEASDALPPLYAVEAAASAALGELSYVDHRGDRVPADGVTQAEFDEARVTLTRTEASIRLAGASYERAEAELLQAGRAAASDPDVVAAAYRAYEAAEAGASAAWAKARHAVAERDALASIIGVADVGIGSLPESGYWRPRSYTATPSILADADVVFAPARRVEVAE